MKPSKQSLTGSQQSVKRRLNVAAQNPLDRIGETGRKSRYGGILKQLADKLCELNVSGASQNMVFGGPGSFLKTAAPPILRLNGARDLRMRGNEYSPKRISRTFSTITI